METFGVSSISTLLILGEIPIGLEHKIKSNYFKSTNQRNNQLNARFLQITTIVPFIRRNAFL
jgi:hypothetical protein